MVKVVGATALLSALVVGVFTAGKPTNGGLRSIGASEAATVYGGDTVFHECNNTICYDTSCHPSPNSGTSWKGDPSTAGAKSCGWAVWGSCDNSTGPVQCKTTYYLDTNCTLYDKDVLSVPQNTCN